MRTIWPHVPAECTVDEILVPARAFGRPVRYEVDASGDRVADCGPLRDVGVGWAFECGDEWFPIELKPH